MNVYKRFALLIYLIAATALGAEFPPHDTYTPNEEDHARFDSLVEFSGTWVGSLTPEYDPNGVWREFADDIPIRVSIKGDAALVELRYGDEWRNITNVEHSEMGANLSTLSIRSSQSSDGYIQIWFLTMHKLSNETARIWFMITSGTVYRPPEDMWSSYGAFALGEMTYGE